jgi:hypothetical protein
MSERRKIKANLEFVKFAPDMFSCSRAREREGLLLLLWSLLQSMSILAVSDDNFWISDIVWHQKGP